MKPGDLGSAGGEHAFDLMILSLGEDEAGVIRIEDIELGRLAELGFAFEEQGAAVKDVDESGVEGGIDGHGVAFFDVLGGGGPAVIELPVVGEEKDAGRVPIEPADGLDTRVAAQPLLGKEGVYTGAFTGIVGADVIDGLVEQDEESLWVVEGIPVDANEGGIDFERRIFRDGPIDRDGLVFKKGPRFASAAITEGSEDLIEASQGRHLVDLCQLIRMSQKIWIRNASIR